MRRTEFRGLGGGRVYNGAIRDRVRLKVLADNPGDWMTHCHILPHAGDGMMTVLRVED